MEYASAHKIRQSFFITFAMKKLFNDLYLLPEKQLAAITTKK
jgi:hypothetical protein